ncbi:hypothetical protein SUNI508_12458 [Seiridium unicorne]|uniref:Uncharacterized protein n=1 Tax=Seiridium unicorne TaxID=138068 RepID=A0ABR2UDT0_9PEZI
MLPGNMGEYHIITVEKPDITDQTEATIAKLKSHEASASHFEFQEAGAIRSGTVNMNDWTGGMLYVVLLLAFLGYIWQRSFAYSSSIRPLLVLARLLGLPLNSQSLCGRILPTAADVIDYKFWTYPTLIIITIISRPSSTLRYNIKRLQPLSIYIPGLRAELDLITFYGYVTAHTRFSIDIAIR